MVLNLLQPRVDLEGVNMQKMSVIEIWIIQLK